MHTVPKSLSSLDEARKMEPQRLKGDADVGCRSHLGKRLSQTRFLLHEAYYPFPSVISDKTFPLHQPTEGSQEMLTPEGHS